MSSTGPFVGTGRRGGPLGGPVTPPNKANTAQDTVTRPITPIHALITPHSDLLAQSRTKVAPFIIRCFQFEFPVFLHFILALYSADSRSSTSATTHTSQQPLPTSPRHNMRTGAPTPTLHLVREPTHTNLRRHLSLQLRCRRRRCATGIVAANPVEGFKPALWNPLCTFATQSRLHHSSLGLAGGGAGRGQWPGRRPERQGAWDRSRVAETQGRRCSDDGRSGCGGSGRGVVTGGQWRGGGGQGERAGGVMGARLLRLHH